MKIIDLLNKIASGETPPKKIKYGYTICYYNEEQEDYLVDGDMSLFSDYVRFALSDLNTDIEILEEDKKIENIEPLVKKNFTRNQKQLANKLNEVIEVLNGLNRS